MSDVEVNVSELTFELTEKLRGYLAKLVQMGGSDLHVKTGATVRGRVDGEIVPIGESVLSYKEGLTLAKELLRSRFGELVEKKISILHSNSTTCIAFG